MDAKVSIRSNFDTRRYDDPIRDNTRSTTEASIGDASRLLTHSCPRIYTYWL